MIKVEGFRLMLPSGAHCNACHGLVSVEEANMGLSWDDRDWIWDWDVLAAILALHRDVTCRVAPPPVMAVTQ